MFIKVYREDSLRENEGQCTFCHDPLNYKNVTADHRHPKSKGGLNQKTNIVAACEPCNKAKGSMSEAKFRKLIKTFPSGQDMKFIMAWSRRKLNLQTNRSINNIKKYFGME